MTQTFLILLAFLLPSLSWGADLRGRMGIGMSNQLANDIPALSIKVQQSKSFALGGILGFQSNQDNTLYGAGLKFYQIIFDEPQLNFYMAGLLASQSYLDTDQKVQSGYQVDATMGSEFHFAGLESLGFSLEFGLSVRKSSGTHKSSFQTLGDNFLKGAVHFYL
jgi:hypothetical protein